MTTIEIRPLRPADGPAVLETFREVFGHSRSLEEWNRMFFGNPAGTRGFVAELEGRIIAQHAGIPCRTWVAGEERLFVQAVDLMVHPEFNQGLKREGIFVQTSRAFYEQYGEEGQDALHYGWPIEAAWRIGRRFLGLELVREEVVLVRPLEGETQAATEGSVEVLESVGEQLRWLYERCAGAWGASTMRDESWWRWRFQEHPARTYTSLGLRDGEGILRGLAVLREGAWDWPGAMPLCEWLVPDGEVDVARALEGAVRSHAARAGAERLVTLFPDWSPAFARFQELGWRVHPSPYRLVVRSFDERLEPLWLQENWWTQLGDSDLV